MNKNWEVSYFKPDEPGVFPIQDGIRLAAECPGSDKECGVVLFDKEGRHTKIPFSKEGRQGTLFGIQIKGDGVLTCRYQYYIGENKKTDSYAERITGLEKWGAGKNRERVAWGGFLRENFDWEDDFPLQIPYEDSILYGVNVRAFTMHKSSGVKNRGTFEGLCEKLPYLKDLGITTVVLMPCYEYEECMREPFGAGYALGMPDDDLEKAARNIRLNCWGFQEGYYFSPKASYCAGNSPSLSFKSMVKAFHQNGIEVMMHFYFPPQIKQLYILKVIKHWVKEYHIDGVRLSGYHIPFRMLSEEAFLGRTKIWCDHFPEGEVNAADKCFRNFAHVNGNFKNDIRRFLKGDEGIINDVLTDQRRNPPDCGVVNYLADYDGFSLYDSVSYDRKHNEENGEDNRDGTDYNYSWNCGVEGETKKTAVLGLRSMQMKNAFSFLFLSQGTPYLFGGDEFANTRNGNNNCYCQDNAAGWVKWKNTRFTNEILEHARFLIHLRKEYKILHRQEEFKVMDTISCGYPDISYHGTEAWRPDFSYVSRVVGAMLCGQYEGDEPFFYTAYNMHWQAHQLALPKLPAGQAWVKISDTAFPYEAMEKEKLITVSKGDKEQRTVLSEDTVKISARSVSIYQSTPFQTGKKKGRGADKKARIKSRGSVG